MRTCALSRISPRFLQPPHRLPKERRIEFGEHHRFGWHLQAAVQRPHRHPIAEPIPRSKPLKCRESHQHL